MNKRYVATVAQAFRVAAVSGVNDVSEDDLAVDVSTANDDHLEIYLTELNSGGLGQVELILEFLRQSPENFLDAMRHAISYCPRRATYRGLSKTVHSVVVPNPHQGILTETFEKVRSAKSFKEQQEAKQLLQDSLETTGLPVSRSAVVALVTKLLRPGSSVITDKAMYLLNKLWKRTEHRLGIEIDARVFSYLCTERRPVRRRVLALLNQIGESQHPSPAQVHSAISQFLIHDCRDACPECLDNPNRYNNFGKPSRSLARSRLSLDAVQITVDDNLHDWLAKIREVLRSDGRVCLVSDTDQLLLASKAVQGLLAEEIEVDYLLLPITVVSTTRQGDKWYIELQVKGFGYGT